MSDEESFEQLEGRVSAQFGTRSNHQDNQYEKEIDN